ncbi:MAG: hypothetical protein Q9P14_07615 [candidate division KSB1 bacterium]|nr:hypothetical protein [candidate division KSB1 bacterium]MDQ7064036.1 hypothetical protein [candidate division KSB1 bacterium]
MVTRAVMGLFVLMMTLVEASIAQYGYLKVELGAPDVQVYVDEVLIPNPDGDQVVTAQLTPGTHMLRFVRPGYRPELREVSIQPDRLLFYQIDFKPSVPTSRYLGESRRITLQQATASFVVVSNPPDMPVKINGQPLNERTPVAVELFPVGPVQIQIGDASATFHLEADKFRRFKYERGRIFDATYEISHQVGDGVELLNAKLAVEYESKLNVDWNWLRRAAPQNNFQIGRSPMYLLCILFFRNHSDRTVEFNRSVRIYRGEKLVETRRFRTRLLPGASAQGWYNYTRRRWPPGIYRVEILHENGRKLASMAFRVYRNQ